MTDPYLQYFDRSEFKNGNGDWWDLMSPRLLVMLDVLRFMLGCAITISPSRFALGRRLGARDESEHNVDHWGACLAADVFISGIYTRREARLVVQFARRIGFTGIGVYSDTTNHLGERQVMFHLGVRSSRKMGAPAEWGRVDGSYDYSLEQAIDSLPDE